MPCARILSSLAGLRSLLGCGPKAAFAPLTYPAVVSCAFTFWVIRFLGGDSLRQIRSPYAVRALSKLDQHPVLSTFFLRLLLQTSPPLNYALAMSGIRFKSYLMGTLLGLPIPIAVVLPVL